MQTEVKEPLYKRLNKERTQGNWETSRFKEGDFSLCKEDAGDMICEGFTEANAEYTALAVNNLHVFAEAFSQLKMEIDEVCREVSDSAKQRVYSKLRQTDSYKKLEEALNSIS